MIKGYTMIELLIIVTVSGLLISLGTSAYSKAKDRQELRADVELTLETLQSAKKQAVIGEKDCNGIFLGIQVTITQGSQNLTHQAICQGDVGAIKTKTLLSSTPTSSTILRFRPLDGSTNLAPTGVTFNLTTSTGLTTTFTISQSGAITYASP